MLSFRVRNIVPPGGRYFFEVPETGAYFEEFTLSSLLIVLTKHYRENNMASPDNMEAVVMDFMCRRLPEGFCYGDLDGKPRAKIWTLDQIKEKTMTLAAGNPRVVAGVSKDRSMICGNCERNDRSMCPSCVGLVGWSQRLVGMQSGISEWLGVCTADGVSLTAAVFLKNVPRQDECPAKCWRS